ncbi:hypothetical protein HYV81_02500 [Candidatus Woesearchaeota archaeon]|nr:hypothetical protein [Candidatus Woesearchaeota archaeon]
MMMAAPRKFPKARKRYIAFRIEGEASRKELELLLRQITQSGVSVKLVAERYDEHRKMGLLKTGHKDAIKIREMLANQAQITIKTMGTSGTIKTAVRKYFKNI